MSSLQTTGSTVVEMMVVSAIPSAAAASARENPMADQGGEARFGRCKAEQAEYRILPGLQASLCSGSITSTSAASSVVIPWASLVIGELLAPAAASLRLGVAMELFRSGLQPNRG